MTRDAILRVELRRLTRIVRRGSIDLKSRSHEQTNNGDDHDEQSVDVLPVHLNAIIA